MQIERLSNECLAYMDYYTTQQSLRDYDMIVDGVPTRPIHTTYYLSTKSAEKADWSIVFDKSLDRDRLVLRQITIGKLAPGGWSVSLNADAKLWIYEGRSLYPVQSDKILTEVEMEVFELPRPAFGCIVTLLQHAIMVAKKLGGPEWTI